MQTTPSSIAAISQLKSLHSLSLDRVWVTGDLIHAIAQLRNLNDFVIRNSGLDKGSFEQLTALVHLKALTLNGSDITDDDISILSAFPNLLYLSLKDTPVTDNGSPKHIGSQATLQARRIGDGRICEGIGGVLVQMPVSLHWEANDTEVPPAELERLRKQFPGRYNNKAEMELGYW